MTASLEIICSACGADALLLREARYEGFKKVGENLLCSACGHPYEDESGVPFKGQAGPAAIFTDADRSTRVDVFTEDEKGRLCRYCKHYTVNPFTQRCGLHNKIVEATDTCGDFSKQEEDEAEEGAAD